MEAVYKRLLASLSCFDNPLAAKLALQAATFASCIFLIAFCSTSIYLSDQAFQFFSFFNSGLGSCLERGLILGGRFFVFQK